MPDLLVSSKEVCSNVTPSEGLKIRTMTVEGIGLKAGRLILGANFDADQGFEWLPLNWPTDMTDRLTAFYSRYLMARNASRGRMWNGHSFVASVMGARAQWSGTRTPLGLQSDRILAAEDVEPGSAYVIRTDEQLMQSFIGMDHGLAMSVPGRGVALHVMPTTTLQSIFPGFIGSYDGLARNNGALAELLATDRPASYDLPNPQHN